MKYLVATDMDGTLTYDVEATSTYDPHAGVPAKSQQEIKRFIDNGGVFSVATGRLFADVVSALGEDISRKSYKITQNGSFIFTPDNELIFQNTYSQELFEEVTGLLQEAGIRYCISTATSHFYPSSIPFEMMQEVFGSVTPKYLLAEMKEYQPVANICIVVDDPATLDDCYQQIERLLDKVPVHYKITGPQTIDINPETVNKAHGVLHLAELVGVQDEHVYVVGDSYNDLPMFQRFSHSYCMAHSREDLRKQANKTVRMFYEVFEDIPI